MYRFTRSVTVRNAAEMPGALQFCIAVTDHLNKAYDLNMRAGAEMFGATRIHWFFDMDTLEDMSRLNAELLQDGHYCVMLEKAKHFWLDGSSHDKVVKLLD